MLRKVSVQFQREIVLVVESRTWYVDAFSIGVLRVEDSGSSAISAHSRLLTQEVEESSFAGKSHPAPCLSESFHTFCPDMSVLKSDSYHLLL